MKKNYRTKKSLLALILALMFVFTACSGGEKAPETSTTANPPAANETSGNESSASSDILYVGMTNAPASFNIINTTDIAGRWVQRYMYDSLLTMPTTTTFEPGLADSFETEDNQTFTIKLNEKAVWSDGTPVTADDVVFTLNYIANPEVETARGSNIAMLEGTTAAGKLEEGLSEIPRLAAVDDKTVTLKTKKPVDPAYIKEFLGFEIMILPKHIVEPIPVKEYGNSDAVNNPTVTSGPFKFVQYQNGSYVELASNPDYYKGEPEFKKVFIKIMNGTNLVTEFQSGGIHMAAGGGIGVVPVQDLGILRDDQNMQVDANPGFNSQFMMINNTKFSNQKFRQALAYGINRDLIVQSLLKGEGEVMSSVYPLASPYMNENLKPIEYNPEKAKELLAESGFDTSQEINLIVPIGNKVREQSANLIEQDLEAIGLKITQTTYDFPTVMATIKTNEFDLCLIGFGYTVEPDVATYYSTSGSMNFGKISDAHLDELLEKGTSLTSFDERKTVYDEIQQYMQDNTFILGLYSDYQVAAKVKALNGGITSYWAGSLAGIEKWNLNGLQ
nr:ABC transporter substrate-binding protein [Sedimentibacter sp.]